MPTILQERTVQGYFRRYVSIEDVYPNGSKRRPDGIFCIIFIRKEAGDRGWSVEFGEVYKEDGNYRSSWGATCDGPLVLSKGPSGASIVNNANTFGVTPQVLYGWVQEFCPFS